MIENANTFSCFLKSIQHIKSQYFCCIKKCESVRPVWEILGIVYAPIIWHFSHIMASVGTKSGTYTCRIIVINPLRKALLLKTTDRKCTWYILRIILCMHPANERRCYIVTSSLIGWVHTQNHPWHLIQFSYPVNQIWHFSIQILYILTALDLYEIHIIIFIFQV